MKPIQDYYKLKTSQSRNNLRDIVSNNFKRRLLLYGTQHETTMISALVVKYLVSKERKV